MATGEQRIETDDGTLIFVKQFHVRNPKAQILVSHGYLEHCGRYEEFAKHLNSKDIDVTLFDLRGHGNSEGKRGYLDDWNKYITDLDAVYSTLLSEKTLPTFLFGHSTGALIIIDSVLQKASRDTNGLDGIKGVVLTGPYVQPAEKLNPVKKHAAKVFGQFFPSLPIPAGLDAEQLTHDPVKKKEHTEDEKIFSNATAGWAFQCMMAQDRAANLVENTTLPFPVLYVYGDEDVVACPEANEKFAAKLKAPNKTVLRRKGERHEVLNESNRQELFEIISSWILL